MEVTEFWEAFGDPDVFVEVTCDDETPLAPEVLRQFNIPCSSAIGGGLPNLDIKRMDAVQVIKLSLLEASANDNVIYDMIVDSEGKVDFVPVGQNSGLSGSDIYYELQTGSYREDCGGVMVIGARPLAYRKPIQWHFIWENGPKEIFDTGLLLSDTCVAEDFNQQATIVFNDPHLDSRYLDGIDNLYEINRDNPYDSIIGYARFITWEGSENDKSTVIKRQDTATFLLEITPVNLGTLFRRPPFTEDVITNPQCYEGETPPDITTGVKIEIPPSFRFEAVHGNLVDKFQNILDVYVVGLEIDYIRGQSPDDASSVLTNVPPGNAIPIVDIDDPSRKFRKLTRGEHYIIGYEGVGDGEIPEPYIVFANNSAPDDPLDITGEPIEYNIDPDCRYARAFPNKKKGTGVILPIGKNTGFLVQELHVSMIIETPSIDVYSPDGKGKKARAIADDLKYLVAPLVVVEEPSPIAFNGALIDASQGIKDHDPTTQQDFEDTDLEKAYDEMSGNGLSLTLTFLDKDQCQRLSSTLYEHLNSGDGTESTFVCGPDTEVTLGGLGPNGGIINSVSYSYQDSNSYTISVNSGAPLVGGFSQIDGGPVPKATEEVATKGTIIADLGNHIHFKVRTDDFGERMAINMAPTILRVGDKVQCTVHNCPVEA
jgi:hypothetical protein